MLRGIKIILYNRTEVGKDAFNKPIYEEHPEEIENVLVAPVQESVSNPHEQINLDERRVRYTLGIPKGDKHEWEGKEVEFFGQRFKVVGIPTEGIEAMIPLSWNKKVVVERYG